MPIIPGILDMRLELYPIKRISPSRYQSVKMCALKEVWMANQQPILLPATPAAYLGSVIHTLLEEAGQGCFTPNDSTAIEERWTELIASKEQTMQSSWFTRHHIPLKTVIQNFEIRRIQSKKRALEISQYAFLPSGKGRTQDRQGGTEIWVSSSDNFVGGYIDRVLISQEGPIIQDYKSGNLYEEDLSSSNKYIKPEYELQLRLYAALYASTFQQWPIKLQLISLSREIIDVNFSIEDCSILLNQAIETLSNINRLISSQAPVYTIKHQLANPSPSNCQYCPFRPGCEPYHHAQEVSTEEQWPNDIRGTVQEIRKLGNSKYFISLSNETIPSRTINITGLSSDPRRHPAISSIQIGDRIGLYNLRKNNSNNTLSEGILTTIYKIVSIID